MQHLWALPLGAQHAFSPPSALQGTCGVGHVRLAAAARELQGLAPAPWSCRGPGLAQPGVLGCPTLLWGRAGSVPGVLRNALLSSVCPRAAQCCVLGSQHPNQLSSQRTPHFHARGVRDCPALAQPPELCSLRCQSRDGGPTLKPGNRHTSDHPTPPGFPRKRDQRTASTTGPGARHPPPLQPK